MMLNIDVDWRGEAEMLTGQPFCMILAADRFEVSGATLRFCFSFVLSLFRKTCTLRSGVEVDRRSGISSGDRGDEDFFIYS